MGLTIIKKFLEKNPQEEVLVVVPTDLLKTQWSLEVNKLGLFSKVSIEVINSAIKVPHHQRLFVIDEAHRVSSTTFKEILKQSIGKKLLGLTGTFERLDGKHELTRKYCPVVDTVTIKDALANGWVSDYREYKVMLDVDDIDVYKQLNQQFISAFSTFNFDFNLAMNCVTNIIERRKYAKLIKMDHKELDAITFSWNRALRGRKEFITNHPKKIEIARKILSARKDKKAITFSSTIKQAEKIGVGFVVHSGKTKKKNKLTMEEFSVINVGVINTSKSLDEGVDCPGLNLGIILGGTSSMSQKVQRRGRIIRKEENKVAELFTLVIRGTVEEKWFNTSNAGSEFIELSEDELNDVLNGGNFDEYIEIAQEELQFRF